MVKNKSAGRTMLKILAGALLITTVLMECSENAAASALQTTEPRNEAATYPAADTKSASTGSVLDTADMFTERDLTQNPDLTDAITYTLADNTDILISEAGVYVLQGTAANAEVFVEGTKDDKIQLVLDGVSITNSDKPCIYVKKADKVFVTTVADSSLTVSGEFAEDDKKADAPLFSCDDLVLNGTAALTVHSSDVGVAAKDDLKVTGGTYMITAATKAFEANDSIRIADGAFILNAGTDGLHAENTDDDSMSYVYIANGNFDIQAGDDGIHGSSVVQLDGGTVTVAAAEGIEGTYVQINGGTFQISASDDGINAGKKSKLYAVTIEITGGELNIVMADGDTDAIDSNGDLIVSGGTLNITARSAFDYDGTGTYTGGTLIVNGEQVTELTQIMMGGGMRPGGDMDGKMPRGDMGDWQRPNGDMNGKMPPDRYNKEAGFDPHTMPEMESQRPTP